ncbi:MAG: hypothetical protein MZW92_51250 [Comamonadaceae bacterium]|nr:hypothetical protein [Comamonadaceae bacterium]
MFLTLAAFAGTAFAGPAADSAQLHFKAIGAGDVEQLARGYASDATLQWVGGPLDGVYRGNADLRALWGKFATAQGSSTCRSATCRRAPTPRARPSPRTSSSRARRPSRCATCSPTVTARSWPRSGRSTRTWPSATEFVPAAARPRPAPGVTMTIS